MSYPIQFLVITVLAVLGCAKVTLQSRVSKKYIVNTADSVFFNAQLYAAIALVLLVVFPQGALNGRGIFYAVLCGLFTLAFQIIYSLALKAGPVSITVLIINFSSLFIAIFSILAFRETVYISHVIGAVLLVVSMILNVKKDEEGKPGNMRWFLLAVTAMLATSGGSIMIKIFGKTLGAEVKNSDMTFLVLSYAIEAVLAFGIYFVGAHVGKRERMTYKKPWHVLVYALIIGVVLGVYQKFYAMGMAKMDASFMMPTYAGMQSVGMTVIGVVMFKDRLSTRQKVSVLCGIACIIIMNLRILPLF